jgi:hypothetical protein
MSMARIDLLKILHPLAQLTVPTDLKRREPIELLAQLGLQLYIDA